MSGPEDMTTSELRGAVMRSLGRILGHLVNNMSRQQLLNVFNALEHEFGQRETAPAILHQHQFEDVNWLAVGSLAATGTVQIVAALNGIWQSWANRNLNPSVPTEYERVVNSGETIRAWSLVIPEMAGLNEHTKPRMAYGLMGKRIVASENGESSAPSSNSTVTMYFAHDFPSLHHVHTVRQHEPYQAKEKILFNIPSECRHIFSSYVSSHTILVVFRFPTGRLLHMLLFDTYQNASQRIQVLGPEEDVSILCAYATELPQVHVVYFADVRGEDEQIPTIEIFQYVYNFPADHMRKKWPPSSSISIPVGPREGRFWFDTGRAIVLVAFDDTRPNDSDAHLCISFDRIKTWRVETMTEWMQSFRASTYGSSILNAIADLAKLLLPSQRAVTDIQLLRYFNRIAVNGNGSHVLCLTDGKGVLRRWIKSPALKQVAIEALYKIKPDLTPADLEKLFGPALASHIFGEKKKGNENPSL